MQMSQTTFWDDASPSRSSIVRGECVVVVNNAADADYDKEHPAFSFELQYYLFAIPLGSFNMMKSIALFTFVVAYFTSVALGFAPAPCVRLQVRGNGSTPPLTRTFINIGDQERERLTRDSEPGDYFKTCVWIVN
jgi:hypothetical protein